MDAIPQSQAVVGGKYAQLCAEADVKSDFQGCYCLVSTSEYRYYKGRTYIGYTVDPNRRVRQHNVGKQAGGAKKTDNRGPWEMVLVIHGFMNAKDALRFEWAWQNPDKSRRLSQLKLKRRSPKESQFAFRFRVACHMLRTAPWCRAPLTVRWLNEDFVLPYPVDLTPPNHMNTANGLVDDGVMRPLAAGPMPNRVHVEEEERVLCALCGQRVRVATELAFCPNTACFSVCHLRCLAGATTGNEPECVRPTTSVQCAVCAGRSPWHKVVRLKRAYHGLYEK